MTPETIDAFFKALADDNPAPEGELCYTNPYTLLVAVVLSAQSTDIGVNKATKKLFEKISTPEDMLALGEAALKDHVKTIGLFNSKARHIMGLSHILVEQYQGIVPESREALESLPGVGRKTANVVLNMAFGWPTIAVDTHIFRLGNRTGLAPGQTPRAVEEALEQNIPDKWKLRAHHWLILLGRYVCKARKPDCGVCPVRDLCEFSEKTIVKNL